MRKWLIPALAAVLAAAASVPPAPAGASSHARQTCARDDRGPAASRMRHGAPSAPLVPHGATLLRICDYNGMNATPSTPQFGLLGAGQTPRAATIRRITAELDALKPAHGVTSCPFDDASEAILRFSYGAAEVTVSVGTKGCDEISSGKLRRLARGAPVVGQIEQLARPVSLRWATVVGRLRLCGGPAPGRCWFQKETWPYASRALAVNSNGLWVVMAQLHHNRFHFTIATPGRCRFELMGSGKQLNTVVSRTTATVRAGSKTSVVFTIPVP